MNFTSTNTYQIILKRYDGVKFTPSYRSIIVEIIPQSIPLLLP